MKKIIPVLLFLFLISCKDDPEKVILSINDVQLIDQGHITYKFNFDAERDKNGTENCTIRTINIKKNDTIKLIDAFAEGNLLAIDITSSPYDFDCNTEECLTVHDLKFKLIGLKKGTYDLEITINGGQERKFSYNFNR